MGFCGAAVLLALGVRVGVFAVSAFWLAKSSVEWPAVSGKIVQSGFREVPPHGEDGWRYPLDIRYEYSIGNKAYSCGEISFSSPGIFDRNFVDSKNKAEQLTRRYPKGREVEVHYKPDNPAMAVLEPGLGYENYIWCSIALFIVATATVLLIHRD